jgi:hypothetical protein
MKKGIVLPPRLCLTSLYAFLSCTYSGLMSVVNIKIRINCSCYFSFCHHCRWILLWEHICVYVFQSSIHQQTKSNSHSGLWKRLWVSLMCFMAAATWSCKQTWLQWNSCVGWLAMQNFGRTPAAITRPSDMKKDKKNCCHFVVKAIK